MKYNDLLKENKTLQKKIENLTSENKKLLDLSSMLNKQVLELKSETIKLTKQKEMLSDELKASQNPITELINLSKSLGVL